MCASRVLSWSRCFRDVGRRSADEIIGRRRAGCARRRGPDEAGAAREPTAADGCFAHVFAKHPRGSHLLGGVLHLLAGLLNVAFHLVAAPFLGEAGVAGRLSCRFLHCPARTICLVAHGSTSSGVVSAVRESLSATSGM